MGTGYAIGNFSIDQLRNGKHAACYRWVMDARRRLLSTKEAKELHKAIAKCNSSFLSRLFLLCSQPRRKQWLIFPGQISRLIFWLFFKTTMEYFLPLPLYLYISLVHFKPHRRGNLLNLPQLYCTSFSWHLQTGKW